MTAELISGPGGDGDPLLQDAPGSAYYLVPPSACPPEYAGLPIRDLFAQIDTKRQERTAAAAGESLAAGFRPRTPSSPSAPPVPAASEPGSGFETGGVLDACAPGGPLAGLADAATRDGRLAELGDDELIGMLRAWHRLESWCSAGLLAVIAELARRRPADRTPPAAPGQFPEQPSEFISDEVAAALTLSARAAGTYLDLALDLATRLPATARAHHDGVLDYPKARLIAEVTRILTNDQAREVEARILPRAGGQTLGQLRAALARAILAVDPDAATRRREEAQKDPRVRRWQEDAGTAALGGFGLPPADVLEADQRLTARALALRDAGLAGSLEELRARAYLDTLLGQDSTPSQPNDPTTSPGPSERRSKDPGPTRSKDPGDATPLTRTPAKLERVNQRGLATRLNLTVSLTSLLGLTSEPGNITGFGPLDAPLARDLAALAAKHPASGYCVTVTGDDGQPLGHGCARGRLPGPIKVTISPLAQDACTHRHQEPGYQPSRRLRHLIEARTKTCSAPGCRRPAARCDLDHTAPYDQGGRTCECNLAPLCRHHHRAKQSEGWRLDQPSPGTMCWTTPAGRRYITEPDAYP
jgi:Domain of unknown function (DUF222)